jgi:cytochrome c peroxidase
MPVGNDTMAMHSIVGQNPGTSILRNRPALWLAMIATMISIAARSADDEPVTPVPPAVTNAAKSELGRQLFHDVRLSHSNSVACVSCHRLESGGDDGHMRPPGTDARPLDFNSPTIFNAALNYRLNWRGNFRTLEEQNEAVLLDRRLMNTSWEELLPKLRADPDYVRAFVVIYGNVPDRTHVLDALATFQRSLVTPGARFDRYLNGEHGAIATDEERGYQLFKSYGCIACHQGMNLGGNLFQVFGVFSDPVITRWRSADANLGRFAITGLESDRYVFRVPSLRNVAVTAPYFHDGSVSSLPEAVDIMARIQLGRDLPDQDVDLIVKFLGTLTGEYRGRSLTAATDQAPR